MILNQGLIRAMKRGVYARNRFRHEVLSVFKERKIERFMSIFNDSVKSYMKMKSFFEPGFKPKCPRFGSSSDKDQAVIQIDKVLAMLKPYKEGRFN